MKRLRLAVAEDEPDTRTLLVRIFQYLGHQIVCEAADGGELIELCLDSKVDLVFVDLDMPKLDGLAAAEVLSKKGIPVILVSGHPDVDSLVVEHEPIVAFLRKPVSIEVLRTTIASVVADREVSSGAHSRETPPAE